MGSKTSSDNTEVDRGFNVPDNSWVVHEGPERRPSQWVLILGALAVICLGAWILQNLWDSSSVVEDPPATTPSFLPEPPSDEIVPDEPPFVTEEPLVSLLDEWPGVTGAMMLRGVPLTGQPEAAVNVTVVGNQLSDFPSAPGSQPKPLWISADGQIVAFPEGAARSNQAAWSWIARGTIMVDPNESALWSVDHKRRVIALFYQESSYSFGAYELDPELERVLGRLENGFLVVRSLDSGGSEFAIWTDDGPIVSIEGLAGREILDIGSSTVLLRAAENRIVAMDVSELGIVTTKASINVDFDVDRACLSPDETLVAVLGSAKFVVVEMDPRVEFVDEPLVDDFTWIANDYLLFTRRTSLLATDLDSAPVRIAGLSPDYSWQVASSTSAC